jgi:hypothetical protein
MAENQAGRQPSQPRESREPKESQRREVPLDSSHRAERDSLGELEGRRQHLNEEEEMARRNQRSHLMRMKNRLRARR